MKSKIFGFLVILSLIAIIPVVDAQEFASKGNQRSIEVTISNSGDVHVKHVVAPSNSPNQIDLIDGTIQNLSVTDENGEKQIITKISGTNSIMIFPLNSDSIVEYDLEDVLLLKDNVWVWNFLYLETTFFVFPEEVNLIFTNERPVYLDEKKGIACHGCQMILEYSINEPRIFKNVMWENDEFTVEIQSHSNIDGFVFDQPTKSITFDISKENKFVTAIIPLELLWKPYSVFLDDEKILFHESINNGTHISISMKPETSGEIMIVGTTVIPEFPIIAPLAIGFLMIIVVPLIRKVNLH
jgi:hypothetical protein